MPPEPFLFIRHGQTNWSRDNLPNGPQDDFLNDTGRAQAKSAAHALRALALKLNTVMISSTLKRARETAQIVAQELNIPVIKHTNIHERYFGDFRLVKDSPGATPPDAESLEQFHQRIRASIKDIFRSPSFEGKTKIIVSHAEVFKYLTLELTGHESSISNGEVCRFCPGPPGEPWFIEFLPALTETGEPSHNLLIK